MTLGPRPGAPADLWKGTSVKTGYSFPYLPGTIEAS